MPKEELKDDDPTLTVEELSEKTQEFAAAICRDCSELRSCAVVFDYEGVINTNPDVPIGVWTDELGPIRPYDLDIIRGSLGQIAKMMASQASLAIEAMSILELQMGERQQELRKLEKYVDIKRQDVKESEQGNNEPGDA